MSMFLIIDKPKGITSHDVVDEVRKITGERKVGHAGTLDPNATGVLVIGVGRESTKKLGTISKDTRKVYEAEIFLGEERDTDDVEGEMVSKIPLQVCSSHVANLRRDDKASIKSLLPLSNIKKVLGKFVGEQMQIPPAYSAIKIKGKKAYEMARKGQEVKLKPRQITIHSIEVASYDFPILKIVAEVSSGTYVRALARDIGISLGCGAYLKNLRRTAVGEFKIEESVKLDLLKSNNWESFLVTLF
ncbi:tRNA pseudouridine(55) synthase TruB [Patescibacteria group bacterium]|nr:tRNA pseudouridine(55) synthase TruB [Patescibacteria group bacterium]